MRGTADALVVRDRVRVGATWMPTSPGATKWQLIAARHHRAVEDLRFGATVRAARLKRAWRQVDLAKRARVSQTVVSRVERGQIPEMTLAVLRRVAAALEIRLELLPRGQGAELDRLLGARHSALHESVARALAHDFPDWVMASEVSFSVWGERGVIDLLLWHPERRALLIIEFKTELVDVGDLLSTMDRRRRLASEIVEPRGWRPRIVSTWVILAESRTNARRIAEHRTVLRIAFPAGLREVRRWLREPVGSIAGLSLWREPTRRPIAPTRRVRCPALAGAKRRG
jgi:transcriptional regulator with XRE-family HTH domain